MNATPVYYDLLSLAPVGVVRRSQHSADLLLSIACCGNLVIWVYVAILA